MKKTMTVVALLAAVAAAAFGVWWWLKGKKKPEAATNEVRSQVQAPASAAPNPNALKPSDFDPFYSRAKYGQLVGGIVNRFLN